MAAVCPVAVAPQSGPSFSPVFICETKLLLNPFRLVALSALLEALDSDHWRAHMCAAESL